MQLKSNYYVQNCMFIVLKVHKKSLDKNVVKVNSHSFSILYQVWSDNDSSVVPIISDINECTLNVDGCDHTCTNTLGSYYCRCRSGYRLATGGRTCQGNYCLISCKINIHSAVFQI